MPSVEERITALERKVAIFDVLQSHNTRKADEGFPPVQVRHMTEANEHITILLGVISSQGGDIREIKEHMERLETLAHTHTAVLDEHTRRFSHLEALLMQILARLPEKP
jgi:Tfp pilus assembly protein PilN